MRSHSKSHRIGGNNLLPNSTSNKTVIEEIKGFSGTLPKKIEKYLQNAKNEESRKRNNAKPSLFVRNEETFKISKRTVTNPLKIVVAKRTENSNGKFVAKRFQRIPRFAVCCKTPQTNLQIQDEQNKFFIGQNINENANRDEFNENSEINIMSISVSRKDVLSNNKENESTSPLRKHSGRKQAVPTLNFTDVIISPVIPPKMPIKKPENEISPKNISPTGSRKITITRPILHNKKFSEKDPVRDLKFKKIHNDSIALRSKIKYRIKNSSLEINAQEQACQTNVTQNEYNNSVEKKIDTPQFKQSQTQNDTIELEKNNEKPNKSAIQESIAINTDKSKKHLKPEINEKNELLEYEKRLQKINKLLGIDRNAKEVAKQIEQKLIKRPKSNVNHNAFVQSSAIFDLNRAIAKRKSNL